MKKTILSGLLLFIALMATGAQKGAIPFDYPLVENIKAKAGDFVLAPPRLWIDQGFQKGGDKQTFIYYAAKVEKAGKEESILKQLSGSVNSIPNSMIIPLRRGEKAKKGSILLTWWQSGSGMQRAIVVGGSPATPKVRYLDMDYNNPAGIAQREDTLKPDSFHKITNAGELGTSIATKKNNQYKLWQIVGKSGSKVLAIGFAGKMTVLDKSEIIRIPVKEKVKVGESVFVPYIGTFTKGVVKKIMPEIGRVFVEITFAGKKKEAVVSFGNIIKKLP